ncbi:MAG: hypothetical protein HC830_06810 [Bacteroidetes bacterium]|nr:hypothetical protein [Bacteroidota bacterium]
MKKIVPEIERTNTLVKEIHMAGTEQSGNINHINDTILRLGNIAQQNAEASDVITNHARDLLSQAENLKNIV